MDFEAFPARVAGYAHITVSVIAVLLASLMTFWLALGVAVVAGVTHWLLAKAVEDVVSPAYSEGHPLVNMPPEMREWDDPKIESTDYQPKEAD